MSFLYSAIGNNTPENREHLEKVGLKKHGDYRPHGELLLAFTSNDSNEPYYVSFNDYHSDLYTNDNDIDCRNNDPLFQAVTALRDDNDYMQWFTDGKVWQKSLADEAGLDIWKKLYKTEPHKATLSELQERFK